MVAVQSARYLAPYADGFKYQEGFGYLRLSWTLSIRE